MITNLCHNAYIKILEAKSNNPDIIHKPNAYFHTLVKIWVLMVGEPPKYSYSEQHEEIVKNHVTRIEENPERFVEISKLYQVAKTDAREELSLPGK